MIRVIVVDDNVLAREVASRLLQAATDVRVVGSFDDGTEAVRFLAREAVDVAVVDIAMRGGSGIDVARRMRAVSPKTQLLMLAKETGPQHVRQAFWAGAAGYMLKELACGEVVAAVRAVHAGQRYLPTASKTP
jgi:DNA-binding NarL/FixJ family response regulator